MKKIYSYFLIFSFFCSFGMIISCEDEIQNSTSGSYIYTTDSLTSSLKSSIKTVEETNEALDEAMEELTNTFDAEI